MGTDACLRPTSRKRRPTRSCTSASARSASAHSSRVTAAFAAPRALSTSRISMLSAELMRPPVSDAPFLRCEEGTGIWFLDFDEDRYTEIFKFDGNHHTLKRSLERRNDRSLTSSTLRL